MKVSELQGAELDYWVAKAEELDDPWFKNEVFGCVVKGKRYAPSTDWSQGGQIIERERIESHYNPYAKTWVVRYFEGNRFTGDTMLIAGMRCFVASKFGEYVADEDTEK